MRTTALIVILYVIFFASSAHAQNFNLSSETKVQIKIAVTANLVNDDIAYTQGKSGFYVFVASARTDGFIYMDAIESVATCTSVRPRFGRTLPSLNGFKLSTYAVYYGPYRTNQEANDVRSAIRPCIYDTFVSSGVMQRF